MSRPSSRARRAGVSIAVVAFAAAFAPAGPVRADESDRAVNSVDERIAPLTEAEAAAYGNRAAQFARFPPRFRPDLDFREALDPSLAEAEPRWSQGFEELVVRDFFGERREGVLVDVGCYHPRKVSTTYYLEKELGWSGIGIDAQPHFAAAWKRLRPRSVFVSGAVSDRDGETVTLYVAGSTASLEKWVMESLTPDLVETRVETVTLDTLLDTHGIEKVDFLSIDIDGAEPAALAGFDIQRFKPDLSVIEAVKPDLVKAYFEANGYELIEKYSKVDKINLYFRPKSPSAESASPPQ